MKRLISGLRLVIVPLLALVLLSGCGGSESRPPVFVLVVDSLRPDVLGIYGGKAKLTPAVDRLARDAVVYSNAVSAAPWTKPSVASMFTGVSALGHGTFDLSGELCQRCRVAGTPRAAEEVTGILGEKTTLEALINEAMRDRLEDRFTTLAEFLQRRGYRTLLYPGGNPFLGEASGLARGFDEKFGADHFPRLFPADIVFAFESIEHLIALPDFARGGRPVFAYVHFMDMHGPYRCSDEEFLRAWSVEGSQRRTLPPDLKAIAPDYVRLRRQFWSRLVDGVDPASEAAVLKSCYAGGAMAVDRAIGAFQSKLMEIGIYDKSLIVLTADHGEEFGEHGKYGHQYSLHEPVLHVPLVVKYPGNAFGGSTVSERVSLIDIFPTIAALLGAPSLDQFEGASLISAGGKPGNRRKRIVSAGLEGYPYRAAVYDGRWKFVLDLIDGASIADLIKYRPLDWPPEAMAVKFDLESDPREEAPIPLDESDGRRIRSAALRNLASVRPPEGRESVKPSPTGVPEQDLERLKSLGYIR